MTVEAILATPRVLAALRALLLADVTLTARLHPAPAAVGGGPGIYTEGSVPANAQTDFLTIGPFTERPDGTMGGGWGSELTTMIKLITQSRDTGACLTTIGRVIELLHGTRLTVADYAAGWVTLSVMSDVYQEMVAGVVMSHYATLWTIRVHQPA